MDKKFKPHQTGNSAILRVRDLSVESVHNGSRYRLVNSVSFDVPKGQTTAIVGESGSGKTLTALSIMGLLPDDELRTTTDSRIYFRDQELLQTDESVVTGLYGSQLSMVFQEPGSALNPVLSIGEQLVRPLQRHMGFTKRQAMTRAEELLYEVGISNPRKKIHFYPHELSGGQKQRVMIAMAISCSPQLIIADEPTSALDVTTQKLILDLFYRLQQEHALTLLFITHDFGIVSKMADSVVVFHRGEIKEQGEKTRVLYSPQEAYTQALIASRMQMCRFRKDSIVGTDGTSNKDKMQTKVQEDTVLSPPLLEVRGLAIDYNGRKWFRSTPPIPAVGDITFTLNKGETLGIAGESGSGKTTVAMAIMRLIKASKGQVFIDGKEYLALTAAEFRPMRRRIQIVFQNPYGSLNPRWTIARTLMGSMDLIGFGNDEHQRRKLAGEMLEKVGLDKSSLDKYPHQFSGGQRQRIAIARALIVRPDIIIYDEVVSALDASVQIQILDLLRELQKELDTAYLFISHDLNAISYIADRLLVMRSGEIVEEGLVRTIFEAPRHPYTAELLEADLSIVRGM